MMRKIINFNQDWLYIDKNFLSAGKKSCDEKNFCQVNLPHANKTFPHHNFDDREYQFISWYRKWFSVENKYKGQKIFIDFDGVMMAAKVYVNGKFIGEHGGGYTPFSFDITDYIRFGAGHKNVIAVCVDSRERKDIPPCGNIIDYMLFGGIYRDVHLRVVNPLHIKDVFAMPGGILKKKKSLGNSVIVANEGNTDASCSLVSRLTDSRDRKISEAVKEVHIESGGTVETSISNLKLKDIKLWSINEPNLYRLQILLKKENKTFDSYNVRIGFREASFSKDGNFYLNGKSLKLFGLNRHQTFPYVGAAMPARIQRKDADILKYELGLNIVRTSHYPQSPHFLNRCDEIGLLVFEEIPGWQHIGDKKWQEISKQNVRDMIIRDRNHPSIILWGVRINESKDDREFYSETNRIARKLDPSRQTGGVRCFRVRESEFLEDVFTYNDFSGAVQSPDHSPYLITEFCGHMFPTKSWDNEERLVEHALYHAGIHNKQMGMKGIAGAIGWCAFDYNTHKEFGSGDRICYHGACDIFRIPKFAGYFYQSQIDPKIKVVLQAASLWTIGDRSGGGIEPLVIFSNCEAIDVYLGNKLQGTHRPDKENYPCLKHPPFVIKGCGMGPYSCSDVKLAGKLAGKIVAVRRMCSNPLPDSLKVIPDDRLLVADGADCTRIKFFIADKFGNICPYVNQAVTFLIEGQGEIIGENPFNLVAGRGAIYIKAGRKPGLLKITAQTPNLSPVSFVIKYRRSVSL